MANLLDYLAWRGDIRLSPEYPFNEVDSLVLARLVAIKFEKTGSFTEGTIEEAVSAVLNAKDFQFVKEEDKQFCELMRRSERFRGMRLSDFVTQYDEIIQQQFAAMAVHTSPLECCIVYRGTDNTLVGWKEDLNMSYMRDLPSQRAAVAYAMRVGRNYPTKRLRLIGHSKGGNEAIYAALYLPPEFLRRIVRVDNFDGPGFSEEVIEENAYDDVLPKIHSYIPQGSVIGRLLEHAEDIVVVRSVRKGISQHNLYTWEVMKNEIVRETVMTEPSNVMDDTLKAWLKSTTPEERSVFVEAIYQIMTSTEAETTTEFKASLIRKLPMLWKTYRGINEEHRKKITELLFEFIKIYGRETKESLETRESRKSERQEKAEK